MTITLIVALVGLALYLITDAVGKYAAVGELGRLSFFAGLLAYLLVK